LYNYIEMFIFLTLVLCMICIGLYGSSLWYTTRNDNYYSNNYNTGNTLSSINDDSNSHSGVNDSSIGVNGSSTGINGSSTEVNGSSTEVNGQDFYTFSEDTEYRSVNLRDFGPPSELSVGVSGYNYGTEGSESNMNPRKISFKYILNTNDYIGENHGDIRIENTTKPTKFYIIQEKFADYDDTGTTGFNKYKICTNREGDNCFREFGHTVSNSTGGGNSGYWRLVKVNAKDQYILLSNNDKYICIDDSDPYDNLKLCELKDYDESAVKVTLVTHDEERISKPPTAQEVVESVVINLGKEVLDTPDVVQDGCREVFNFWGVSSWLC